MMSSGWPPWPSPLTMLSMSSEFDVYLPFPVAWQMLTLCSLGSFCCAASRPAQANPLAMVAPSRPTSTRTAAPLIGPPIQVLRGGDVQPPKRGDRRVGVLVTRGLLPALEDGSRVVGADRLRTLDP